MSLAFLAPLIGSVVTSVVSAIFGTAEERAKRQTIKEEHKNLKVKEVIEKTKLLQSEEMYNSALARENLTGNPVKVIIQSLVVLAGGIVFPLAIYDSAMGTEWVKFGFDAILSRVPSAYIEGYLILVAAIFGLRTLEKMKVK